MLGKSRVATQVNPSASDELSAREILATDYVAMVLDDEPRLLNIFLEAGFTTLASGYARRTMARVVTLRQACRRMAVDELQFVAKLNEARRRLRSRELQVS